MQNKTKIVIFNPRKICLQDITHPGWLLAGGCYFHHRAPVTGGFFSAIAAHKNKIRKYARTQFSWTEITFIDWYPTCWSAQTQCHSVVNFPHHTHHQPNIFPLKQPPCKNHIKYTIKWGFCRFLCVLIVLLGWIEFVWCGGVATVVLFPGKQQMTYVLAVLFFVWMGWLGLEPWAAGSDDGVMFQMLVAEQEGVTPEE